MDSSRKQPADFLHVQELRSLMGRQRRELLMLDEHGKLKYPPKFRRVQEEYEDTLPTPGTLKQCDLLTGKYHLQKNLERVKRTENKSRSAKMGTEKETYL